MAPNAEDRNVKVIICNLRLVEVGLDLIAIDADFLPGSYDINSSGRHPDRGVSDKPVSVVYYMIADGTQQVSQFQSYAEACPRNDGRGKA